jgi:glycosyltransferase involved in cell wall biosynthesis
MAKIKVLHIITRMIVGGAQENTMYTAEGLDKSRYQVEILCGAQTGSEGSLIEEARARGIHLTILSQLVREINPIKDLIAIIKIYRYLRENKYSIVHTHSSKAGILGRTAAYLASTPIIIHTVHGWSFHQFMPVWRRGIYIFFERITARCSSALIVVTKNDLIKGRKYKIGAANQYHLIRSAVPVSDYASIASTRNLIRQELGIPINAPLLGSVGRFSAQKNPLEWVRVAALVKQSVHDCYFLLVGDGPLRHQTTASLNEIGLLQYTIMTGLRRDIPQILSTMDVFLLTSLWEGLPRVIPEAMLAGVPVVASQVDGSAEIIQDDFTGYTCPPGDVHALADRCIELLTNPQKRSRIVENAAVVASHQFDLTKMIDQIDQLYAELINHHRNSHNDP